MQPPRPPLPPPAQPAATSLTEEQVLAVVDATFAALEQQAPMLRLILKAANVRVDQSIDKLFKGLVQRMHPSFTYQDVVGLILKDLPVLEGIIQDVVGLVSK